MSRKRNKKTIFSTVSPSMKLLFVVPLSLLFFTNNYCSARAAERDPLLVNERREDIEAPRQTVNLRASYKPLAEIVVDLTALTPPNPAPAEQAMTKIANYIMYASGEEDLMKVAAGNRWTGAATEELRAEFFEAAYAELDQTAPLGVYLRGVLTQITHLQTVVPEFQQQNRILAARVEELLNNIERREEQLQFQKKSKAPVTTSTWSRWKAPVFFIIGGFVGSAITFGITYAILKR